MSGAPLVGLTAQEMMVWSRVYTAHIAKAPSSSSGVEAEACAIADRAALHARARIGKDPRLIETIESLGSAEARVRELELEAHSAARRLDEAKQETALLNDRSAELGRENSLLSRQLRAVVGERDALLKAMARMEKPKP